MTRSIAGRSEVATTSTDLARALRLELAVEEFAHFAAALADQGDHDDIGIGVAGDIGQDRRFADARLAENADALAAPAGQKAVDGADAELDRLADQRCG